MSENTRLERLRALIDEYGEDAESYPEDSEEDLRRFLGEKEPLGRWCAITQHGERVYFYPVYDSIEEAQERAISFATDSLYTELPVSVVDLDTGASYRPNWHRLPWLLV